MEAIGDYYITCDKILDAFHCPLGVHFAHTVGEVRETPRRTESLRVLVVGQRRTI